MPLNVITNQAASAGDWIPQVWAQEVLANLRANMVLAPRINRDYSAEIAAFGNTVNVPKPVTLVAQDKPVSGAATTLNLDTVPITLNKWKSGGPVGISDLARAQSRPDIMRQITQAMTIAIAEAVESDLWVLATSAAATVGTAGTSITPLVVSQARQKLVEGKVPMIAEKYLATHPKDYQSLLSNTNISESLKFGGAEGIRSGNIPGLYGFQVFESQLTPQVGTAPVTTRNLAFARDFAALVTRGLELPQATVQAALVTDTESGLTFRLTLGYDQLGGQHVMDLDILYGVGVLRPEFGVLVQG